jgi:hypothetical protein
MNIALLRHLKFIPAIASITLTGTLLSSAISHANDSEYDQWLKQTQSEFQEYLDKNDKEFIGFLKQKWQQVDVEETVKRDPKPKPVSLPKADPIALEEIPLDIDKSTPIIKTPVIKDPIIENPVIENPISEKPLEEDINLRTVSFDFFGETISVNYNKNFKISFRNNINNQSIAEFWQSLASQPHQNIVDQLSKTSDNLQLNDWGTALLFDQFSRELQGSNQYNQSSRQLTSWFLLVKAGFNARVAYNEQVFLLMPSKQNLFSTTFFTLDNERFYSVSLNEKSMTPGKVFTYKGNHLDGQRNLDFSEPNNFSANKNKIERKLSFNYGPEHYEINIQYPRDMVNYFSTFPQLDLSNYFSAGMPKETAYSLLSQLKPIVEGQSEIEAVNRLLRFVQTAFEYKTDDDQFQQENYLFPLETLHYPYSDCEDRAALFAWLTESLLNLDVVIVDFPGHIATAVEFSQPIKGDSWMLNGKSYTIADPTYVNANAGMTMPQYQGKAPKLLAF